MKDLLWLFGVTLAAWAFIASRRLIRAWNAAVDENLNDLE